MTNNYMERQSLRSRIDKWDLIKLQSFCKAMDTVNRTKKATNRMRKDLYQSYIPSKRRLITNIYKELKKIDSNVAQS